MLRGREKAAWPARVLDAGGSFGAFAAALRSLGVAVVDSPTAGSVDLVIGLALHTRAASAWTMAARSGRLLRPNGRIVLVVPTSQYWPRRLADLRRRRPGTHEGGAVELGIPGYSRRQLRALLWRNGLRPDHVGARDYSPAGCRWPA